MERQLKKLTRKNSKTTTTHQERQKKFAGQRTKQKMIKGNKKQ